MWLHSEYILEVIYPDNFSSEEESLIVQDISSIADGKFSKMRQRRAETYRPISWISVISDMKNLSSKHPTTLFILESKGGEADSHKKYYYKKGQIKIVNPKFSWPTDEEIEAMEWMK